jgi:hypothetical protein
MKNKPFKNRLIAGTSALDSDQIVTGEVKTKITQNLAARMGGQYNSLLDALAGTGCSTKELMVDIEHTYVNDRDPACQEILRQQGYRHVTGYDLGTHSEQLFANPMDLVFLDYNNYTLARLANKVKIFGKVSYWDTNQLAFRCAQKFLILCDVSIHAFKLHPTPSRESYAKILGSPELTDVDQFFEAMPPYYRQLYPDWYLTDIEHFFASRNGRHAFVAYLLFRRTAKPLEVNFAGRYILGPSHESVRTSNLKLSYSD